MGNFLMKYNAANLNQFLDLINRNSIGMEDYFDRLTTLHETTSNYPPYNLVTISNVESRLELALAGHSKNERSLCLHRTVNSLSKDKKKTKRPEQNMSTEETSNYPPYNLVTIRDLSPDLGPSQMKRKLDQLLLRMGY